MKRRGGLLFGVRDWLVRQQQLSYQRQPSPSCRPPNLRLFDDASFGEFPSSLCKPGSLNTLVQPSPWPSNHVARTALTLGSTNIPLTTRSITVKQTYDHVNAIAVSQWSAAHHHVADVVVQRDTFQDANDCSNTTTISTALAARMSRDQNHSPTTARERSSSGFSAKNDGCFHRESPREVPVVTPIP